MATETNKIVFETEVNGASKTLVTFRDYKDALSALKKEQENLAVGSDAWAKNQKEIEKVSASIKELSKTEEQRAKENEANAKKQEKAINDQSNALKKLNEELKKAKIDALNGDGAAAKRVAELQSKIGDLNQSIKQSSGSGIERLNSSWGNFREGLENFDLGKIKSSLNGLGAAFKAVPIFLIVEGVQKLIEHWDELGKGNGIIATGIQFLNKAFDEIIGTITKFTDLIGLTNSELDKQGEAIKGFAEKTKEALNETTAAYDRQIRVAKANGEDTVKLEIAKQEAIVQTNVVIAKQIEAFVRAGGELDEEKRKLLTASLDAIKNAKVTELEIETTHTKKLNDEYQKRKDEKKKKEEESIKDANDLFEKLSAEQDKEEQKVVDDKKKKQDEADKLEADRAALRKSMNDQANAEQIAENQKVVDSFIKAEADKQAATDASFQHAQLVTQNLQAISDLAFSVRGAKLKKGSAEEEALMKRQFEINKKLQVAQTVISTITGAREAYKSLAGIPIVGVGLGIAAAAAATIAGLGAIQKINNTKFESSSAPSTDSGGGGSFNASNSISPTTQAPRTNDQPFTRLDDRGNVLGNQPVVKAIVVETDITDSQKRVGRLKSQASFG